MGQIWMYNVEQLLSNKMTRMQDRLLQPSRTLVWPRCDITQGRADWEGLMIDLQDDDPEVTNFRNSPPVIGSRSKQEKHQQPKTSSAVLQRKQENKCFVLHLICLDR